jgi:hypothetical protein
MYKRTLVDPLQVIGTDPGSVNFGLCHVKLHGFMKKEAIDDEPASSTYLPIVSILNWELWNIKKQLITRFAPTLPKKFVIIDHSKMTTPSQDEEGGGPNSDTDTTILKVSLNKLISESGWIFETYRSPLFDNQSTLPMLSTEVQCGHIKNKNEKTGAQKWDITLLSHILPSSIDMVDRKNKKDAVVVDDNVPDRRLIGKLYKYGVSNEEYDGRKEDSINVTRDLLAVLGLQDAIDFLDNLLVKKPSQKVDDLADAFLLALQTAIEEWQRMNGKVYIIHKKQQEKINRTPMMKITKQCSVCDKMYEKEVKLQYKAANRKEKCIECKLLDPPAPMKKKKKQKKTVPPVVTPKKQKKGVPKAPVPSKKRTKEPAPKKKEKPSPSSPKKKTNKRKRKDSNKDEEPVTKKQKKTPSPQKRITLDLTAVKPQFPKNHLNTDEEYDVATSFEDRVRKHVSERRKYEATTLEFI